MIPAWLKEMTGDPRENYLILESDEGFYAENDPYTIYPTARSLYEAHEGAEDYDLIFVGDDYHGSDRLNEELASDQEKEDGYLHLKLFGRTSLRLPLDEWASTLFKKDIDEQVEDPDRKMMLRSFYRSVERVKSWRNNPDDVRAAYYMLDCHPIFWTKGKHGRVNTNQHVQGFWHSYNGDVKTPFMMECGAHVEPHYTTHYHDPLLDTWGKNFEDCIIQTAKKVDQYYTETGEPRQGVIDAAWNVPIEDMDGDMTAVAIASERMEQFMNDKMTESDNNEDDNEDN